MPLTTIFNEHVGIMFFVIRNINNYSNAFLVVIQKFRYLEISPEFKHSNVLKKRFSVCFEQYLTKISTFDE